MIRAALGGHLLQVVQTSGLAFHPTLQHVASAVSYVFYNRPEAVCHLFAIAAGILSGRF
jgi:hypothetical protein